MKPSDFLNSRWLDRVMEWALVAIMFGLALLLFMWVTFLIGAIIAGVSR